MKDKESIKKIKQAYDEACNCGYNGTLLEYIKKVGWKPEPVEFWDSK